MLKRLKQNHDRREFKRAKKLNLQINKIISELKKSCLKLKVKQNFSDKIELSVFNRIIKYEKLTFC